MKITVIGTGYVGLVTATCFAESGNDVIGIDKDAAKIATLDAGRLPIYEPGLLELVQRNRREGRLNFTTDLSRAIAPSRLIFIAVGTPQGQDGSADLSSIWSVGDALAEHVNGPKIVVIKSTVPVGTNRALAERLEGKTPHPVDVASNPEFLKLSQTVQPADPAKESSSALAAGKEAKDYVAAALKSGELRLSCHDPDNPRNWPRNLFVWRSNLLGSSGKGHEYFLKHLLGTTHGVMGKQLGEMGARKPTE